MTSSRSRPSQAGRSRPAASSPASVAACHSPPPPGSAGAAGLPRPSDSAAVRRLVADPHPGRAVEQRLERERQPRQCDERRRQRPCQRATPTSRGTSATKIWLRTTIAIPTTIAGTDAERQRGAVGGSSWYVTRTTIAATSDRNGIDRTTEIARLATGIWPGRNASIRPASETSTTNADDGAADEHHDEEATRRPPDDVALRGLGEDPGERDVERAVQLADRPDHADDADDGGERRAADCIASTAPSIRSASGGNAWIRASPTPGAGFGIAGGDPAGQAEHEQRRRDRRRTARRTRGRSPAGRRRRGRRYRGRRMTLATCGWSRTRARIAAGSISRRPGQPPRSSNRTGWTSSRLDATGRRDERPDLAAPDEPPATELDALEPAGPRPAADRRRAEMDVGRGQDLGRLGEGDPVRRRGHRQSVAVDAPDLDGLSRLAACLR